MGSQEAARELLENTDLKQQRQALIQMKPHRAAALLEVRSPGHTVHMVSASASALFHRRLQASDSDVCDILTDLV